MSSIFSKIISDQIASYKIFEDEWTFAFLAKEAIQLRLTLQNTNSTKSRSSYSVYGTARQKIIAIHPDAVAQALYNYLTRPQ